MSHVQEERWKAVAQDRLRELEELRAERDKLKAVAEAARGCLEIVHGCSGIMVSMNPLNPAPLYEALRDAGMLEEKP
jgi:hypothetical protein